MVANFPLRFYLVCTHTRYGRARKNHLFVGSWTARMIPEKMVENLHACQGYGTYVLNKKYILNALAGVTISIAIAVYPRLAVGR